MFQFNGWAILRVDDSDDPDSSELTRREDEAQARHEAAVHSFSDGVSVLEVRTAGNDLRCLITHGLSNHRTSSVLDLYQWVADQFPCAYGLLYVWDDEDDSPTRGDNTNCFRVWKLACGVLTEEADALLSPCMPVIERP